MNVRVIEEEGRTSLEVTILCKPGDARVPRIVSHLRAAAGSIVGYAEPGSPEKRVVKLDDLLYLETLGGNALLHLVDGSTLESPMRLFELEEALEETEFVRASRQTIVNFDHVAAVCSAGSGRLVLKLDGGTKVLVTRSYAPGVKSLLGIKR